MAQFLSIAERKEFAGLSGHDPRRKDAPPRLVLHTTETKGLPAYSSPPHFTVAVGHPGSMPSLKEGQVKIWQHVSLDKTAYALLHPKGTEETNHMGSHCVQIEMVTYVGDQPKARPPVVGNRGNIPEPLFLAVADLVREILAVVPGIRPVAPEPAKWSASRSFGATAKQRFTPTEWRAFNGICGHEHVPANSHWDPGKFDITRFLSLVIGSSAAAMPARLSNSAGPTPVSDSGWPKVLKVGDRNHKVVAVRGILQALGYGDLGDSELYNSEVENAVMAMQADLKIRKDGKWGPESHGAALERLLVVLARADVKP